MDNAYIFRIPACTFYPKSDQAFSMDPCVLALKKGSWTALMGPSGAGKTTLLRMLSGLMEKNHVSRVDDDGMILSCHEKIGFFSPKDQLLPWLSLHKNIALSDILTKKPVNIQRIQDILALMQLEDLHVDTSVHTLSSGMTQRILLARTLYACPTLLFLDEPFGHMDPLLKRHIIVSLQKTFPLMTVLFITHDVEETDLAHEVFDCVRLMYAPFQLNVVKRKRGV